VDLLRKSALGLLDLDQYPKPLYNPSPGHTSALRSIRQRIVPQGDSHCEVQPCECVGASHMSKPERLGLVVLTVGGDTDVVRAAQERILELNTTRPPGVWRSSGSWLHFRVRDVNPAEFKTGAMELSIKDTLSSTYVSVASGPRHLPGRIWPFVASDVSVGSNKGVASA